MEFKISQEEFVKGLHRTQSVVEKKGTMPILLNVLIEAQESEIVITATDLEIGLKGRHPAEIIKSGKTTLSAKKIYEVIKELPEKEVSFRLKENHWVEIKSGKSTFNIMGISAEAFPSLPSYEEEGFLTVETEILKEMVEKTVFAVSTDEARYNLNGVFFVKKESDSPKEVRMVATDGYRLSLIDRSLGEEMKGLEKGILLPKKGLIEMNKILEEGGKEGVKSIGINLKGNNFILKRDPVILIMRLLDAEFPDYRQVIPKDPKRQISVKRSQIQDSLRRVSILSSEKTRGVKFQFNQDFLELSSYNPEFGEAKEELSVEYKGETMQVGFNSRFVMEVLNNLKSEEVVFEIEDNVSPAIIRPADDPRHTCVIMPMRI
jgi:DNA polymerase III subunit beta